MVRYCDDPISDFLSYMCIAGRTLGQSDFSKRSAGMRTPTKYLWTQETNK
jgi:hypothetical protein